MWRRWPKCSIHNETVDKPAPTSCSCHCLGVVGVFFFPFLWIIYNCNFQQYLNWLCKQLVDPVQQLKTPGSLLLYLVLLCLNWTGVKMPKFQVGLASIGWHWLSLRCIWMLPSYHSLGGGNGTSWSTELISYFFSLGSWANFFFFTFTLETMLFFSQSQCCCCLCISIGIPPTSRFPTSLSPIQAFHFLLFSRCFAKVLESWKKI